MKCSRCKELAVVSLPSHHSGFCQNCFFDFFTRQVERAIRRQRLFTKEQTILVALSGGKDSLALLYELTLQGYAAAGLHIDLGIPGSSEQGRRSAEAFCRQHDLPLIIKEMDREGLAIPLVKARLRRPVCSACGQIKRYYFNKTALEEKFSVLATGHNLDDEIARLFSNILRWDLSQLGCQSPALEAEGEDAGFVRKVKPLWRLSEFETANYAFLRNIASCSAPCPYSHKASFSYYKRLWSDLEARMPGRKLDCYQGFLERGLPLFQEQQKNTCARQLGACERCGYPSSAAVCGVCRIKEALS